MVVDGSLRHSDPSSDLSIGQPGLHHPQDFPDFATGQISPNATCFS
jgi:hypothetical protein